MGWSARGFDGVNTPKETVISRILKNFDQGAIVLIHEGYDPIERGYSPAEILKECVDALNSC